MAVVETECCNASAPAILVEQTLFLCICRARALTSEAGSNTMSQRQQCRGCDRESQGRKAREEPVDRAEAGEEKQSIGKEIDWRNYAAQHPHKQWKEASAGAAG